MKAFMAYRFLNSGDIEYLVRVDSPLDPLWTPLFSLKQIKTLQGEIERLTAELAECRRDAERWKWLVSENNKGGSRAKFLICWWSKEGDGYETTNGTSVDGHDPEAIVRLIDNAMEVANA